MLEFSKSFLFCFRLSFETEGSLCCPGLSKLPGSSDYPTSVYQFLGLLTCITTPSYKTFCLFLHSKLFSALNWAFFCFISVQYSLTSQEEFYNFWAIYFFYYNFVLEFVRGTITINFFLLVLSPLPRFWGHWGWYQPEVSRETEPIGYIIYV
jgi:hypothetical protein